MADIYYVLSVMCVCMFVAISPSYFGSKGIEPFSHSQYYYESHTFGSTSLDK
jgi:hypothetical protein